MTPETIPTSRTTVAAWIMLGLAGAACLWWFAYWPAMIGICVVGILVTLLVRARTAAMLWLGIVSLSIGMLIPLIAMASTESGLGRCPEPGTTVILKQDKPPVSCGEIRAGAASMTLLFLMIGGAAALVPVRRRAFAREDAAAIAQE